MSAITKVPPPTRRKEEPPPRPAETLDALETLPSSAAETLNFKVTSAFKREYKSYAVSQGLTMIELLKEGFELSRRKRGH